MAISIVRLYYIAALPTEDFTWNYVPVFIWQPLEIDVAIICACLPVMAPLFRAGSRKLFGLASRRSRANQDHYHEQLEDDTRDLVNVKGQIQLESVVVK